MAPAAPWETNHSVSAGGFVTSAHAAHDCASSNSDGMGMEEVEELEKEKKQRLSEEVAAPADAVAVPADHDAAAVERWLVVVAVVAAGCQHAR